MNLQELRDVQDRERATDSLQQLPEEFYADVAAYIQELKDERERAAEQADDPFGSPEVGRLTDEIQTAEQVAESIYERRLGKVLDQASLAASDVGGGGTDGLTEEERALFEDVVDRITENKRRVLDVLAGDASGDEDTEEASPAPGDETASGAPAAAPSEDAREGAPERSGDTSAGADAGSAARSEGSVDAADVMGGDGAGGPASTPDGGSTAPSRTADRGGAEPDGASGDPDASDAATDGGAAEHTTVHVTRDVGEVFGVDERVYSLAADDVVSLPAENARALVERDAAEPLE